MQTKIKDVLRQFLRIIEQDNHYQKDAPKTIMVRIFSIVGQRSELADEYRKRLRKLICSPYCVASGETEE